MSARLVSEVVCDRCGRFISDEHQTLDQLRDTLQQGGWAAEVGGFDDACLLCCEVIEHDAAGIF